MPDINVNAGRVPAWYYVAGAGVLFVGFTFYRRFRSASSTATPAPAATASTPVVAAGSYGGPDYTGELANIQQQLQALNAPTTNTTGTTATKFTGAITPTAANQTLSGSGYQPNNNQAQKQWTPLSANSHLYLAVTDLMQAVTLGGTNLYYEPTVGVFSLIPGGSINNLTPGTTIYRQVA